MICDGGGGEPFQFLPPALRHGGDTLNNRALVVAIAVIMVAICISTISFDESDAVEPVMNESDLRTAIKAGGSVTLGSDITLTQFDKSNIGIEIPTGITTILDLNGHYIKTDSSHFALANYGELTIQDSSVEETGLIESRGVAVLVGGSMTVTSGTITCISDGGGAALYVSGELELTGGTVKSTGQKTTISGLDYTPNGISILENGTATITGGKFEVSCFGIVNNGTIEELSGVTAVMTSQYDFLDNYGTVEVGDIDITTTGGSCVVNESTGSMSLIGSELNSNNAVALVNSEVHWMSKADTESSTRGQYLRFREHR